MSDTGGAYSANADEVRRAAELIDKIAAMSGAIVGDFAEGARATSGWEGDDSYGRSLRTNLDKELTSTTDTGKAVAEAIGAVSHGSLENARNILKTQAGNLDAILTSRGAGSTGTGRKS
ncbi:MULTISPECIES: hypothetical protein [Streptomyces]|jgi:hypothetical protein|uniref:hypothetical protein n=1 Tax=Streptomyces TaxID=1883 RepID=UPI000746C023|nr:MULTISPECIES: hypothetical protein [unclassified Streptomyces]KUO11204.1 hypothetical protein AQJ58_15720 [Streptomyces sp. DSM 15324]MDX3240546.1 hypothetical protein [Streptomyces sp. ME18-1-4]